MKARRGEPRQGHAAARGACAAVKAPLGSHVSAAGGLHEAARRLGELGADALQVFTKNNNQWASKPITREQAELFRTARERHGVRACVSHDSYLINLAADGALGKRSNAAFVEEIRRCAVLGIEAMVFHPGAHVGAGVRVGLTRVAASVRRALEETAGLPVRLLIEITAGEGTCLGSRFEEVRDLLDASGGASARLGTCFDTCHAHAAGYDLSTEESAQRVFDAFDATVGLATLGLVHLNDAKKPAGSRLDRHEHIGRGTIGLSAFRAMARDPRFEGVPKVLETEKGLDPDSGRDRDAVNLERLRALGF